MIRTLIASALLSAAAVGAASAATLAFSDTPTTVAPNVKAVSWIGTYDENVTGSISGARRSPFEGTAQEGTQVYSSITGSARFEFGRDRDELSFVWGSPDTYNSLEFYLDGALVDTFPGQGNGVNLAQAFATFTDIGTAGLFDAVVFNSGTPAFEFAGLTDVAPVPLPAGGLLLLTAVAGVAAARRRKA